MNDGISFDEPPPAIGRTVRCAGRDYEFSAAIRRPARGPRRRHAPRARDGPADAVRRHGGPGPPPRARDLGSRIRPSPAGRSLTHEQRDHPSLDLAAGRRDHAIGGVRLQPRRDHPGRVRQPDGHAARSPPARRPSCSRRTAGSTSSRRTPAASACWPRRPRRRSGWPITRIRNSRASTPGRPPRASRRPWASWRPSSPPWDHFQVQTSGNIGGAVTVSAIGDSGALSGGGPGGGTGLNITQSYSPITTVTDSSGATINWATANNQLVVLTGSDTIAFSGIAAGQTVKLTVQQAASGGPYTPTFATGGVTYKWLGTPGFTAPPFPTTASAYQLVGFYAVSTTILLCSWGLNSAS